MSKTTRQFISAVAATLTLLPAAFAQPAPIDPQLVARGAYVAKLGDCAACHTAVGGAAFAGGLSIKSPVGTIFSTNITPDPTHGIGGYSYAQFSQAVRQGIRQDGKTLYPAMPYPEFSRMTDGDMQALYAYFMHGVAPVAQADKPEDIPWPLSIRWFVGVWRWMFAPEVQPVQQAAAGVDPMLARGEYLVTGPGHCGACHTPRGVGMQELALDLKGGSRFLAGGGPIDNWVPVSLRSDGRTGLATWSEDDLVTFLKTGRTDDAAVFGGMVDVVAWSTSQFSDDDLHAVARYLKSLPPVAAEAPGDKAAPETMAAGAKVYEAQCALCHQADGHGVARMFPPLAGNPVLLSSDPTSLVNVVLNGAILPPTRLAPSSVQMPAFRDMLSDQQVADVVNYMRQSWGNQAAASAKVSSVAALRRLGGTQASLGWTEIGPQPYGVGWTFSPQSHDGSKAGSQR